jgi:hypothetical protein
VRESNLRSLLVDRKAEQSDPQWQAELVALIPRLNHDVLVELSLHLALEAQIADQLVWETIEEAVYPVMH